MKVLITGANGLLGLAVQKLLVKHFEVTSLVRGLKSDSEVNYHICDLAQNFNISELPQDIDIIVHMAQSPFYREFPERAEDIYALNCTAMLKLLDYARLINVKHFIYTSTGSVYEPYSCSMEEDVALNPGSFYANSKLIAERLLISYKAYFKVTCLRLFFLYGKHYQEKQTLINSLIKRVDSGKPISIEGDNEGLVFTPTYTGDVARFIKEIIEKEMGGTYNFANPSSLSLKFIANVIGAQLKREVLIERKMDKEALAIVPSMDKFKSCVHDFEFTTFADGLRQILE